MNIEGERLFALRREAVLRAVLDPELIADTLPGVGRVEVRDADHWATQIAIPFVARAPRLRFEFVVVEREEPSRIRIQSVGRTLGASLRVDTSIRLEEQGEGTKMSYAVGFLPGGLLSRVPEPIIERAAGTVVERMVRAIERTASRFGQSVPGGAA